MGAEVGATTSTFPYSENMRAYLHATGRGPVANAADNAAGFLAADEGAEYDEVIEIVSATNIVADFRTSRRSNPISMVHSLQISLLPSPPFPHS